MQDALLPNKVLKAFIEPIKTVMTAECTDYADDITIIATGNKAGKVIVYFYDQLQKAKAWLTQNNMPLNEKKEQLHANNIKFRKEWEGRYPDNPGKLVKQCKDLGVCHRNSRVTNNIVIERTQKCVSICKKISTLPINIVLGGTLYGAEVDHLTKDNLHKIRQVLGAAIWEQRTNE